MDLKAIMSTRRSFLSLMGSLPAVLAVPAEAFEIHPYDDAAVEKAIASGKSVVVHVHAWWCLQCHAQASILDSLKKDPTYDDVSFFRVDYDKQKDIVEKLNCPRSTVIAYKGGKEVARMSWGTSRDSVVNVLKAVI
jgi:thioredoxin 1